MLEDQDLELPMGAHVRSYAYSSSGKVVNASKTSPSRINEPFGMFVLSKKLNFPLAHGDVIGALIHLKPPKPVFL